MTENKKILLEKSPQMKKLVGVIYTHKQEISYLNMMYLGNKNEIILSHLKKKLAGYKQQDKKKNILDLDKLITLNEIVEKLVLSKLKCYYCKNKMCITTDKKREKSQWTLDRIDNNIGHFSNNIVIACLECNLKRRCQNKDKFLFTKQLTIKKI